jgi:muramoyltetrapeptide carboxypeptidase LdcA involved in peptidoglycan recycling
MGRALYILSYTEVMHMTFPDKLKAGDEIRVISPSRSLALINQETRMIANKRFSGLGLKLSFGKRALTDSN